MLRVFKERRNAHQSFEFEIGKRADALGEGGDFLLRRSRLGGLLAEVHFDEHGEARASARRLFELLGQARGVERMEPAESGAT